MLGFCGTGLSFRLESKVRLSSQRVGARLPDPGEGFFFPSAVVDALGIGCVEIAIGIGIGFSSIPLEATSTLAPISIPISIPMPMFPGGR